MFGNKVEGDQDELNRRKLCYKWETSFKDNNVTHTINVITFQPFIKFKINT